MYTCKSQTYSRLLVVPKGLNSTTKVKSVFLFNNRKKTSIENILMTIFLLSPHQLTNFTTTLMPRYPAVALYISSNALTGSRTSISIADY